MRTSNIRAAVIAAACLLLWLLLVSCSTILEPIPGEEPPLQQRALDIALSKVDAPYLWGGQGPREFDCSGIILYAYTEALGYSSFLVDEKGARVNDATMDSIYRYNIQKIPLEEAIPGDLVFITSNDTVITHGGLLVERKDEGNIRFLNASSFYGKVLVDDWPLEGLKRGQWLVGFGRLTIQPLLNIPSTIPAPAPAPEPIPAGT